MIVESKPVKSNFTGTREKETIKTRKTPVPKKFDLTVKKAPVTLKLPHNRTVQYQTHIPPILSVS